MPMESAIKELTFTDTGYADAILCTFAEGGLCAALQPSLIPTALEIKLVPQITSSTTLNQGELVWDIIARYQC